MIYINLLIIFLFLVFIHELGHYLTARLFGLKVIEFSVGFGKTLFSYTDKNYTKWKISLIPLGGYVKIKGLESIFQSKNNLNYEKDSFLSIHLYKKIIILLAGSIFNVFSAWICLFSILFFFGVASYSPEIGEIVKESPADLNDIRKGDIINKINGHEIKEFSDIPVALNNYIIPWEDVVKDFERKIDESTFYR